MLTLPALEHEVVSLAMEAPSAKVLFNSRQGLAISSGVDASDAANEKRGSSRKRGSGAMMRGLVGL